MASHSGPSLSLQSKIVLVLFLAAAGSCKNIVQAPPTPPNPGSPQMGGPASCSPLQEYAGEAVWIDRSS